MTLLNYPILSSLLLSLSSPLSFFRMSRWRSYAFGLQSYTLNTVNNFVCNASAYLPNCTALYPRTEVHIDSCENLIDHKRNTFYDKNSSTQYKSTSVTQCSQIKQMMPTVCLQILRLCTTTYRPFFVTIISLVRHWNLVHKSRSSSVTCRSLSVGSPLQRPAVSSDSTADRICDCAIPETRRSRLHCEKKCIRHLAKSLILTSCW